MRSCLVTLSAAWLLATAAHASLQTALDGGVVTIQGDWFRLAIDGTRGGEISELSLFDGSQWNTVFAAPEITFPRLTLSDPTTEYGLANDSEAHVSLVQSGGEARCRVTACPRAADGKASPWEVTLTYVVYPEGAVLIDVDCELKTGDFVLSDASVSFEAGDAIRRAPKYRDDNVCKSTGGFRSARLAFGLNPDRSYTNEVEAIVEYKKPMAGGADYRKEDGRVTWTLGNGDVELSGAYRYANRLALGLCGAVTGKPRSNVVAQRVYHWVNWLDLENWYPTEAQIDAMKANHATMVVLHHEWMLQRGSNGKPHADYRVVRNHDAMVRTIDYAHAKGLRVGLYMRGVEQYALDTGFFEKHCRRNWDGIYVDWHGPHAVSWHDTRYEPETQLGDVHASDDGTYVPARDYFLFTRKLREIVGPEGFLIGHQGSFNAGAFANLCFDAYLPGETGSDRDMFAGRDEAVFKGMQGGGVCMPWLLDLPRFRNPEGAAKMAAWGFYPHIVLGIKARHTEELVFPCDPTDSLYAFILPYWRLLAHIDAEQAAVYNLPSVNQPAVASSAPKVHSIVYKAGDTLLIIAANLGDQPVSATLELNAALLGMQGEYDVARIDAASGEARPHGHTTGTLTTQQLAQWALVGFKLTPRWRSRFTTRRAGP